MKYPEFIKVEKFNSLHDNMSEVELLRKFSENLKVIHTLTTSHYTDFNQLIKEYLEAGLKIFDMDIGIVSNIQGQDYLVCDAVTPDNSLGEGDKFELEGTYCREVVKSQQVIGFPHVGSLEEMKSHPVYQNMKLESYLSAPIFKEGKIFGTLNFSSTRVREFGFSEQERDLISMMASSIGSFLLLREKEENIENSYQRIRKLTAYVAHDLRSPLGNILSIAEIMPELEEDERNEFLEVIKNSSQKSMEIVKTILEAAILGEGKITLEKRKVSFEKIFKEVEREFQSKLGNLKIETKFDSGVLELDRERMIQVISNLLSNAIKYSKEGSVISINSKKENGKVYFEMKNIVDDELVKNKIVGSSEESSIGFGLEIVNEILALHDSKLETKTESGIYIASFLL
ncbi:MAG: GAF domain-containing sensor histidine kinase [Oligoflexia bacterium]|nr:GAF domain-containing sensor histidine kinase [Oligoflexia bacterium]